MRGLFLLLLALATAGSSRGKRSEEIPEGSWHTPAATAVSQPRQAELDGAVSTFTRAWLAEDMATVASGMSPGGIRLQLDGEAHPLLPARQARAALEDYMSSRSTRSLSVSRVVDLGGAPARGFAEARWETVADRTSEVVVQTVFVSFERDESGWRITEIRVL